LFVEAVLYRYRAGIPWRDLPERFGDWTIVHQRFSRWAKGGVFERIFNLLASDHDNEYMMIDATIVRAHQHSAGARKKTARKRTAKPTEFAISRSTANATSSSASSLNSSTFELSPHATTNSPEILLPECSWLPLSSCSTEHRP